MNTRTYNPAWALTVLRIVTGIVFLMHGWQKLAMMGIAGFAGFLGQLGIPGAELAAVVVTAIEVIGGLALILGIATRWVAIPLAFDMLVALVTVHLAAGFFVSEGGYELVLLLLAASVALILGRSGTLALENVVRGRRAALSTKAA